MTLLAIRVNRRFLPAQLPERQSGAEESNQFAAAHQRWMAQYGRSTVGLSGRAGNASVGWTPNPAVRLSPRKTSNFVRVGVGLGVEV